MADNKQGVQSRMDDTAHPATPPDDDDLALHEAVFNRIAEQVERDRDQDRRIRELEDQVRVMHEFVEQMGAFSGAISQMAQRITFH